MRKSDIILAVAVLVALYSSFRVGDRNGLERAPEYAAQRAARQASLDAEVFSWEEAYQGSQQQACDRLVEFVEGQLMPVPPDRSFQTSDQ